MVRVSKRAGRVQFDLEGAAGCELQLQGCCSLGLVNHVSLGDILSVRTTLAATIVSKKKKKKKWGRGYNPPELQEKIVQLWPLLGSANPPVN